MSTSIAKRDGLDRAREVMLAPPPLVTIAIATMGVCVPISPRHVKLPPIGKFSEDVAILI